jgi:hypothetical protein
VTTETPSPQQGANGILKVNGLVGGNSSRKDEENNEAKRESNGKTSLAWPHSEPVSLLLRKGER